MRIKGLVLKINRAQDCLWALLLVVSHLKIFVIFAFFVVKAPVSPGAFGLTLRRGNVLRKGNNLFKVTHSDRPSTIHPTDWRKL